MIKTRYFLLSFILFSFLFFISCSKDNDITGESKGDESGIDSVNYFVSSLDTSLIHFDDEKKSIFIENVSFSITSKQYELLSSIAFKVFPKNENSIVDTFTVSYSKEYLENKKYYNSYDEKISFPVFGLYDAYFNTILITGTFSDGQKWEKTININTELYSQSDENNMNVINSFDNIGFSYLLLETDNGPKIMDLEGNIRWAADEFIENLNACTVLIDNYFYCTRRLSTTNGLYKLGLDGQIDTISVNCGDYPSAAFHHEMNKGPEGILIEINTRNISSEVKGNVSFQKRNSVLVEIDKTGNLLESWDMDDIIGKCLLESGIPVDTFIRNGINSENAMDWFHMNSSIYDKKDNSVIISSRENFVIKVGYNDKQIKWILGDTTKFWYSIDTLRHYAIHLNKGYSNIGQHSLSLPDDGSLLMYNNGEGSSVPYFPSDKLGEEYPLAMISGYSIDEENSTAEESFNIELPYYSPNMSSVQKKGDKYIVTSIPVQPDYTSVVDIYDANKNVLLQIKNYNYFSIRSYSFPSVLNF